MVRRTDGATARALACAALALLALVALALAGCSKEEEPTWGPSAEFSTLESGQGRFSVEETNVGKLRVVVDHSTGCQYLAYKWGYGAGLCQLAEADGSPALVWEAGE